MKKKYISHSHVSINVVMPTSKGQKSVHVSFTPLTGGGSMYITDNKDMQTALEHHSRFGRLFKIDIYYKDEPVQKKPVEKTPEAIIETVNVASLEDAKEYLVNRFGISRTKLRSKKQIMDAAEAHNIEFEGV